MRWCRFIAGNEVKWGLVDASGQRRDASSLFTTGVAKLGTMPVLSEADLLLLPLVAEEAVCASAIPRPGKFMCIGLDYADHAKEAGLEPPSEPILFMKASSATCGPFDNLHISKGAKKLDWEVELGVQRQLIVADT